MTFILQTRYALPILLLAASLGCQGEKTGPEIQGTVQFDGQLVSHGLIHFEPANGKGANASRRIDDGKFQFPTNARMDPGTYKVAIRMLPPETNLDADTTMNQSQRQPPFKNPIPAKYNDRSELTVEVSAEGPNVFEFDLKSD